MIIKTIEDIKNFFSDSEILKSFDNILKPPENRENSPTITESYQSTLDSYDDIYSAICLRNSINDDLDSLATYDSYKNNALYDQELITSSFKFKNASDDE